MCWDGDGVIYLDTVFKELEIVFPIEKSIWLSVIEKIILFQNAIYAWYIKTYMSDHQEIIYDGVSIVSNIMFPLNPIDINICRSHIV